ncbi:hypothetical protein GM418_27180 [Maribellus comscasis]|uniref:Glycosyl hydrolase family 32 N-terminal domain-containing protein n=1 Tax=Maribellus comscasis TaxID=2681766 RepID=A0A6I6KAK0_9BACT|nr:hypothetical protein [Maribellus comscasis]QGY47214.1 hypothetical protein GM418_27180 [Maribellus comscasis]
MINIRNIFLLNTLFLILGCSDKREHSSLLSRAEIPYIFGESKHIIDANPNPDTDPNKWYTNDHCFVVDKDSTIHWFGINNPLPDERSQLYQSHPFTGHLIAKNPNGPWERLPFIFDEKAEYLGAPFVIWHEESQRWVMVIQTGPSDFRGLEVCWSEDLYNWKRTRKRILSNVIWEGTRDPHIIKGADGKYWIHLVTTKKLGKTNESQVIRIKTADFENFEDPKTVLKITDDVKWSGVESPVFIQRGDLWYLFFTYAHRRYAETIVVVSDTPEFFDYEKNVITTLFSHAAEIFNYGGVTYISSCGPEDQHVLNTHGVTLAELRWMQQ